jgi:hypothetical protein
MTAKACGARTDGQLLEFLDIACWGVYGFVIDNSTVEA